MRRVEAEALVGASREEVWELLDDIAGLPRWVPRLRSVTSVSGPAHVGTMWRERTLLASLLGAHTWEITDHRRPTRQVRVAVDGPLERRLVLTLDKRGSGTRLHASVELRSSLPPVVSLLHEMLATFPAGWDARSLVHGAKRAFEGPVGG